MKTFYTYLWLREDGTPYYVGKGTGRRASHISGHAVPPPPKNRILVQEFPSETDALEAEKFLISLYGRLDNGTGFLRNRTDGGETPPNHTGLKRSLETRQRMSRSLTGRVGGMTGKTHTAETRKKMSLSASQVSRVGRTWTPERRARHDAKRRARENTACDFQLSSV